MCSTVAWGELGVLEVAVVFATIVFLSFLGIVLLKICINATENNRRRRTEIVEDLRFLYRLILFLVISLLFDLFLQAFIRWL